MSAPVKHTCPDIDAVINSIDAAIAEANKGCDIVDSNSPPEDCFREILSELRPLEKQLEQLRSDNTALRKWGEELEEKAEELERDLEYEQKQVSKLESKVSDLEKDMEHTESKLYDAEQEIEELKLAHAAP